MSDKKSEIKADSNPKEAKKADAKPNEAGEITAEAKIDAKKAESQKGEAKSEKAQKKSAPKEAKKKEAALKEGIARDIGIPVSNPPKLVCSDSNCPYHGSLSVRGKIFEGKVISDKMERGVVVQWDYLQAIPKYKRFLRKKSRVVAHNPACINAHKEDVVRIAECRPLSKTKSFVVIEIKK